MASSPFVRMVQAEEVIDDAVSIDGFERDTSSLTFEDVYQQYYKRIYWYLYAQTRHSEDASDLTQQVFTKALVSFSRYSQRKGSMATWLFTIARRVAIDARRAQRDTVRWDEAVGLSHAHEGDGLDVDMARQEELDQLARLVHQLPDRKREIVELRFAAGLTFAEIAGVTGKSVEATRKMLTRTLQILEEACYGNRE